MRRVLVSTVILALAGITWPFGRVGLAQTLPLVVDASQADGDVSWWTRVDAPLAGPCATAFLDIEPTIDPREVAPSASVSRVLQRSDLSVDNARALASLYGAPMVLLGAVEVAEASRVPWGGRHRAVVRLTATWLDTQSGGLIEQLELHATGFAEQHAEAVRGGCAALARSVAFVLRVVEASPATLPPATVIVRLDGPAGAYVQFRSALREALGGELQEAWATEGAIGLARTGGAPLDGPELAVAVRRLAPLTVGRVVAVSEQGDAVWVYLAPDGGVGSEQ